MESSMKYNMIGTSTDRITDALATLRKEMLCLREQDRQLIKQLMGMSDTIQTLSKRRPFSSRSRSKTLSRANGGRKFINTSASIPEETCTEKPEHLSSLGISSVSSIEDTSISADSDSDDSLF